MSTPKKFQWPTMFEGLRTAKKADLPREIAAGVTLAALMIPLNIGFTQIVGVPPVFGLYACIVPLAVFAIFTSSRHVVGSPAAPGVAGSDAALDVLGERFITHRAPAELFMNLSRDAEAKCREAVPRLCYEC